MNSQKGFIVLTLPIITLFMTGFLGLSTLTMGIKSSTFLQSTCFKNTLETQKQLKKKLVKLLDLNKKVLALYKKKKSAELSLAVATSLKMAHVIPLFKAKLNAIKLKQKKEYLKQKFIFYNSQKIKFKMFSQFKYKIKNLKIKNINSKSLNRKPLAVSSKKLDKYAYLYFPAPNFSKQQAIHLSWKINPFFPFSDWILKNLNFKMNYYHQSCKSTLKKEVKLWQAQLTY